MKAKKDPVMVKCPGRCGKMIRADFGHACAPIEIATHTHCGSAEHTAIYASTKICVSCGGDGIQKPEERLVSGAVKRCVSCHGRGAIGGIRRKAEQWWTVKFRTNDGDVIRVTTRGTTESEAGLNARKLLDPGLYCEML